MTYKRSDYWNRFDELIDLLREDNHEQIILEFKTIQSYVNGMTDGWHDFLNAFKASSEKYKAYMSPEQNEICHYLLSSLEKSLNNR